MIIRIDSGSSGWGEYVTEGTKDKPRDTSSVELLDGDIELGNYLCENNNYKDKYYRIVLAFKGKPNDETIKCAYDDFKKEFFYGYEEDEFHIDAVVHKDTDDYHIHCRVPKQNLLTNTHLQLYFDKTDQKRKELIQDYISLKNGFEIARDTNRKIFKENSTKHINEHREQHNQKEFNFSKKQGREVAEKKINEHVSELIQIGAIENLEDIKNVLEDMDLKVVKFGNDIKKDFSYVTLEDETGKIRVKGEIYNERFWEQYNKEDRAKQIKDNKRDRNYTSRSNRQDESYRKRDDRSIEQVRKNLQRANENRRKKLESIFDRNRAKARKELKLLENSNNIFDIYTRNSTRNGNNEIGEKENDTVGNRTITRAREQLEAQRGTNTKQQRIAKEQREAIAEQQRVYATQRGTKDKIREFREQIERRIKEYADKIRERIEEARGFIQLMKSFSEYQTNLNNSNAEIENEVVTEETKKTSRRRRRGRGSNS